MSNVKGGKWNKLFFNMLYSQYRNQYGGIYNHKQFWLSQRKNGKYAGDYTELNNLNATQLYAEAKAEQINMIKNLRKKYDSQLKQATNFIENFANMKIPSDPNTTINEITKEIADFFNAPLKSNEGWFYKNKMTLNSKQKVKEENLKREVVASRLDNILNQLLGKDANIKLIQMFNDLIDKAYKNKDYKSIIADYSSNKGLVVEYLINQIVNKLNDNGSIQTGNIKHNNGQSLGEDIIVLNNNSLDKLQKLNLQANSEIYTSTYDILKSLESFSIQVKSGKNQAVFNAENNIYKITIAQLHQDKILNKFKMLNSWNYDKQNQEITTQNKKRNKRYRKLGSARIKGSTRYFLEYIKSEELKALVTLALSHSKNILEKLYRMQEYQVFWDPNDGFITIPEYFKNHNKIWVVANHRFGFDFTKGWWNSQRHIALQEVK